MATDAETQPCSSDHRSFPVSVATACRARAKTLPWIGISKTISPELK